MPTIADLFLKAFTPTAAKAVSASQTKKHYETLQCHHEQCEEAYRDLAKEHDGMTYGDGSKCQDSKAYTKLAESHEKMADHYSGMCDAVDAHGKAASLGAVAIKASGDDGMEWLA